MDDRINGLHHVTAIASGAREVDAFYTDTLGLRRVKKTVNFDAPDVYHLYYGDEIGRPGSVMTHFPFPRAAKGRRGTGEVASVRFAVPEGATAHWSGRLEARQVAHERGEDRFGAARLTLAGPDGETLELIEDGSDTRAPWTGGGDVPGEAAIRGFHSVALRLAEAGPTAEILTLVGYERVGTQGDVTRFAIAGGRAAVMDIEERPDIPPASQGAGSVHHVAFSVATRDVQHEVRAALIDAGMDVTPVIDRDYFWAIYFRSPGGVLFEVATDVPGFDRDEERDALGQSLKLPRQHEHLRDKLERSLEPLS